MTWQLLLARSIYADPPLAPEPALPVTVSIVWRRVHGCWDFFCRAPLGDVERIVYWDQRQTGLSNADYQVRQG